MKPHYPQTDCPSIDLWLMGRLPPPRRDADGVPTETTQRAGNEDTRGSRAASKEEEPAALAEERQRLPSRFGDGIHQLW